MIGGARKLRNGEEIRDAILTVLSDNPLSAREIFFAINGQTEGTATARRALQTLLSTGAVRRRGCRNTFENGCEVVFEIVAAHHNFCVT